MGSITKRKGKRGFRYRAEIRLKDSGVIVHREAKTFSTRAMASRWLERRENELAEAQSFERYSVADAISEYRERYERLGTWGRTKTTTLSFLERRVGHWDAGRVTVGQLVNHVLERRQEASAATVNNDLIWLRVVFKALRPLGRPVALQAVEDAITACRQERLIGRAQRRKRRPTRGEIDGLLAYFERRQSEVPMPDLMRFAIASARRQSEITRLRWADNNPDDLTGLVTDAKHPTAKQGNHRRFKYTQEGWDIANRQPRDSEFIFPYNPKTIGAYFAKACKILEIRDLRWHDFRHEATSRLFEAGYPIVEVQQFTLHDDVQVLMSYTHLRPGDVTLR